MDFFYSWAVVLPKCLGKYQTLQELKHFSIRILKCQGIFKREKTSFPVEVRHSKIPLLKLPNISHQNKRARKIAGIVNKVVYYLPLLFWDMVIIMCGGWTWKSDHTWRPTLKLPSRNSFCMLKSSHFISFPLIIYMYNVDRGRNWG